MACGTRIEGGDRTDHRWEKDYQSCACKWRGLRPPLRLRIQAHRSWFGRRLQMLFFTPEICAGTELLPKKTTYHLAQCLCPVVNRLFHDDGRLRGHRIASAAPSWFLRAVTLHLS